MDVKSLLEQYVFLGQEFLTWLWFISETEGGWQKPDGEAVELVLGDSMVLGPPQGREGARVSVRGREASLAEAREGLKQGKLVDSLRLGMIVDGDEYWVTLRAADLGIGSLKLPAAAPAEDGEGKEGLVLERIALAQAALSALEDMLAAYLRRRLDSGENAALASEMKNWVAEAE